MKLQLFKLAALLLCCQSLSAEPPSVQSAQENLNKSTESLNDPTVMTEKLEQGLAGVMLPTAKNATPLINDSENKNELKDPTRMNQNFREALKRVAPGSAGAPSGNAATGTALPEVKLVASVCGMHKEKNHAMLRINDKTEMVGVGEKITTIKNNQLIEIHVLEIDKGHVKVEVQPANETIILR
jgi:hypothetical protein